MIGIERAGAQVVVLLIAIGMIGSVAPGSFSDGRESLALALLASAGLLAVPVLRTVLWAIGFGRTPKGFLLWRSSWSGTIGRAVFIALPLVFIAKGGGRIEQLSLAAAVGLVSLSWLNPAVVMLDSAKGQGFASTWLWHRVFELEGGKLRGVVRSGRSAGCEVVLDRGRRGAEVLTAEVLSETGLVDAIRQIHERTGIPIHEARR